MKDRDKSKGQLIDEISALRWRIGELEALEAKHAEMVTVLREREERYSAIVRAFDGLVYICSEDYRIEFMNDRLIKRTGYDATGESCYKALHDRESICPWCVNDRVLRGETVRWEVQSPKDDRWYYIVNTPINKPDGKVSKQAMILDITDRKRLEETLEKSSEKIKLFAYSVSHDLKSPATAIYGITRRLHERLRDSLDERSRRYCEQILSASLHVGALVEKINAYIEAQGAPLEIEEIDLRETLQLIRDEFSQRFSVRQIKWVEPDTLPVIKADKLSVLRVFRNFIDNGLKYGGDHLSEIIIGYQESQAFHILSVGDNGAGVTGGDYERLFKPFRRDTQDKGAAGAGLGLAIVNEIAERHRGMVWAEPGEGRGVTFFVSISKDL